MDRKCRAYECSLMATVLLLYANKNCMSRLYSCSLVLWCVVARREILLTSYITSLTPHSLSRDPSQWFKIKYLNENTVVQKYLLMRVCTHNPSYTKLNTKLKKKSLTIHLFVYVLHCLKYNEVRFAAWNFLMKYVTINRSRVIDLKLS